MSSKKKKKATANKKGSNTAVVPIEPTVDAPEAIDPRADQVEVEKVSGTPATDVDFDSSPETPAHVKRILEGDGGSPEADEPIAEAEAEAAEIPVEDQAEAADTADDTESDGSKKPRARSYSHLGRRPDSLETLVVGKKSYVIPATMGSNYWAVLRVMYQNIDQPVLFDELIEGVDETMKDHDAKAWEYFCNKKETTVWKRGDQKREVKKIKSWQDRIIGNAKTLTRWKDYGKRLYERGHCLRLERDKVSGESYFKLYSNTDPIDGGKKKKSTAK